MREPTRSLRCAVYTRKSSEEGLSQDFNSLQAQREACEAYILSQRHEGWRVLPTIYDDGGYSGGSMDRPGLKQLLADIAAGQIDVVVVYKVDRLTRSLTDFARIVDVFDQHQVSFVSVTQSFNTTSSMGRLTLNVLLSFAQFEREVTGERIRDKIAASKKKGLWMGGFVPIGYEPNGRSLTINEGEAERVRTVYRLYLELRSVDALKAELDRQGICTKVRPGRGGAMSGGGPFSRGHLYRMLQNPLYRGKIAHKGQVYEGQHPAIIDEATWGAVQAQLRSQGQEHRVSGATRYTNLLSGLLVDERGAPFKSTHAVKDGKRYRYYVRPQSSSGEPRWSLPVQETETAVLDGLGAWLTDPHRISALPAFKHLMLSELEATFARAAALEGRLGEQAAERRSALASLVERVEVRRGTLSIRLRLSALGKADERAEGGASATIEVPSTFASLGQTRLVLRAPGGPGGQGDPALIKAIARGHAWFEELASGRASTVVEIARREGVTDRYVSCLIKLAFLPPAAVEQVLRGETSISLSVRELTLGMDLPLCWVDHYQLVR